MLVASPSVRVSENGRSRKEIPVFGRDAVDGLVEAFESLAPPETLAEEIHAAAESPGGVTRSAGTWAGPSKLLPPRRSAQSSTRKPDNMSANRLKKTVLESRRPRYDSDSPLLKRCDSTSPTPTRRNSTTPARILDSDHGSSSDSDSDTRNDPRYKEIAFDSDGHPIVLHFVSPNRLLGRNFDQCATWCSHTVDSRFALAGGVLRPVGPSASITQTLCFSVFSLLG